MPERSYEMDNDPISRPTFSTYKLSDNCSTCGYPDRSLWTCGSEVFTRWADILKSASSCWVCSVFRDGLTHFFGPNSTSPIEIGDEIGRQWISNHSEGKPEPLTLHLHNPEKHGIIDFEAEELHFFPAEGESHIKPSGSKINCSRF
jgi:hypothetical protein